METPAPEPATRQALLAAALEQAGWNLDELWVNYLAYGGTAGILDVEAHLADLNTLPLAHHDFLACALNERLADLGKPLRVPYALHPDNAVVDPQDPLKVLDNLLADKREGSAASRTCLRWPGQDCPTP